MDWEDLDLADPRDALRWAERFAADDDLVAVIGHSDSASTIASAPYYNRLQIPQIATVATNPAITDIGPWTYRLCVPDDVQGAALAEHAVERWGKRQVAVFFVDDDYGRQLDFLFETRVRSLGGEVVASVPRRRNPDASDERLVRRTLERLARQGLSGDDDCVVLFGGRDLAHDVLQAMRDQTGLTSCVLGGDSLAAQAVADQATTLGLTVRASMFFAVTSDNPGGERFARRFGERYGAAPDYGAALGYDAVNLVREAVLAGGFSRAGVKAALDQLIARGQSIGGVAGPYVLGPRRDAMRAFWIGEVQGGEFVAVEAVPAESTR